MAKSGFFNPDATPQEPSTKSSFYPGGAQDVEQVDGSFYETDDAYVEVTTAAAVGDLVGEAQAAADAAAASETAAASSETNAAASASAAATSQSAAATSASAAATSQSAAATSASAAAGSASSAATSATNASNSASAAATSETNAAASASAAAGSASAAASSASDAAQSAIDAAAAVSSVATFDPELSVIHVSKIGSDVDTGTQRPSPKLTLASAIAAAAALVSGGAPKAVVRVLDAGVYTENIALPDNVSLEAPEATLVGTLALGVDSYVVLSRHFSNGNSTTLVTTTSASGDASHYFAVLTDGRGLAGTNTGTTIFENASSGRVLMVRMGMQVFVPAGGFGLRDNSGSGFGHIHFYIPDLYLAGNNATGIRSNNANTNIIGYIDHILEVNTPTGTTGIKIGASGGTVKATITEIIADKVYDIHANGTLYLQCPHLSGTRTGTVTNFGGWAPSAADKLLYGSGVNTTAETTFTAYGRTLAALADASALAAQVSGSFALRAGDSLTGAYTITWGGYGSGLYLKTGVDGGFNNIIVADGVGDSVRTVFGSYHGGLYGYAGTETNHPYTIRTNNVDRLAVRTDGTTEFYYEAIGRLGLNYCQFRAVATNYGAMLRNDDLNFYVLLTNSGDPYGSWNTLRPLSVSVANGDVSIGNGALIVRHGAHLEFGKPQATRDYLGVQPTESSINYWNQVNLTGSRASGTTYTVTADVISAYYPPWVWSITKIGTRTRTCDISVAGPALDGRDQAAAFSANTWIYLYWLYSWADGLFYTIASLNPPSSGGPNLPGATAPYCLIGAFRLDGSGNFYNTVIRGNRIYYQNGITDCSVLSGGTASTVTSVSVSSYVPSIALDYEINWLTLSSVGTARSSDISYANSGVTWRQWVSANAWESSTALIPNVSQTFYYLQSAAASLTSYIHINSYSVPNGAI